MKNTSTSIFTDWPLFNQTCEVLQTNIPILACLFKSPVYRRYNPHRFLWSTVSILLKCTTILCIHHHIDVQIEALYSWDCISAGLGSTHPSAQQEMEINNPSLLCHQRRARQLIKLTTIFCGDCHNIQSSHCRLKYLFETALLLRVLVETFNMENKDIRRW